MLGLNLPQVTKNLLLLNILMFVLTVFFSFKGVELNIYLGMHYFNTPMFEPYQLITHIFMHGDMFHLIFNMFALVMFGGFLERQWGPKRFFIFYFASALGAIVLYNIVGYFQIEELKQQLIASGEDITRLNGFITESIHSNGSYLTSTNPADALFVEYQMKCYTSMFGASGAVFGVTAAFAILFPNTELMLIFPPIPIKAKFLIGGYFLYALYNSFFQVKGDHIAHLAHVGGAVTGAIIVLIWQRNRKHFY